MEKNWLINQKEKSSGPLKLGSPEYIVWLEGLKIGLGYYILTGVSPKMPNNFL